MRATRLRCSADPNAANPDAFDLVRCPIASAERRVLLAGVCLERRAGTTLHPRISTRPADRPELADA